MEAKETTKKLAMLASNVDDMVEVLTDKITEYGEDMNNDYEHFFAWHAEDMYKAHVERRYYIQLQSFLRNSPDEREVYAYLARHSNAISDELIDGILQLHSTRQAANLARTLELEAKQKVRREFTRLCGVLLLKGGAR